VSFSCLFRREWKLILYLLTISTISKSPQQLLKCLKIAETSVILIVFNGVICDVRVYTVTVSVALHESGTRKAFLDPRLYSTKVYLTAISSTQNHTTAV